MSPAKDVAFEDDLFKRFVAHCFKIAHGFNRGRKRKIVQMIYKVQFVYLVYGPSIYYSPRFQPLSNLQIFK